MPHLKQVESIKVTQKKISRLLSEVQHAFSISTFGVNGDSYYETLWQDSAAL